METDQAELLKEISSFLENNNISYMITGAWSVIYYGRPRASHDIDFVVEIEQQNVSQVMKSFQELSEGFMVQPESIPQAVEQRSMFNVIHSPTMLKLDFWILTKTPFDKSRFRRRKRVKILGQEMDMATAEDTIIQKLRWYQESKIEKHLIDAAFVYQIQKKLDQKYLINWVNKLGLTQLYNKLAEIDLENYL